MEVIFSPQAAEDLRYWSRTGNKIIQNKIEQLIVAIKNNPFEGIGKPEPFETRIIGFLVSQDQQRAPYRL